MPPRTRAVRARKASKENVDVLTKTTTKNVGKSTKPVRKPLADKTNSASDENASPESVKKVIKKATKPSQKVVPAVVEEERPRRNRRLPPRYVENQVLNNLSNSKENATTAVKSLNKTPVKDASKVESPFKTPTNVLDNSVIANRSKRISRLPSRFDENSVSPHKFVPIQCNTSTPLVPKPQNTRKDVNISGKQKLATLKTTSESDSLSVTTSNVTPQRVSPRKAVLQKATPLKSTPDLDTPNKVTSNKTTPNKATLNKATLNKVTPNEAKPNKATPNKASPNKATPNKATPNKATPIKATPSKVTPLKILPRKTKAIQKKLVQKKISEVVKNWETDLNGRQERVRRLRKPVKYREDTLSPKVKSPDKAKPINTEDRKLLKVNSSFRILEEKKSKNGDDQDIYEFTFDPSEEPAPQKKKRKKVTAKKTTKPKTRVYNNNYEKNIARALADLKNVVTKQNPDKEVVSKATKSLPTDNEVVQPANRAPDTQVLQLATNKASATQPAPSSVVISTVAQIHTDPTQNASVRSNNSTTKHVSIRVEDIAADFDASIDHDINYSPVNSPMRIEAEPEFHPANMSPEREEIRPDDPLNLRNDLSFFDDQPVANSSMNVSTRNPNATPWRAEFEKLPLKWHANTYVKPDMTPALECSFVNNFDDSKKKHVYTNMVAPTDEPIPEILESVASRLKQTSIISFIKEVVERSSSKKKRGASATPTKAQSLFDMTDISSKTPRKETSGTSNEDNSIENVSGKKSQKRKNNSDNNPTPAKLPRKDNDTLFGFDDSENQENVSPVKIVNNNRLRSLRSRSGAVLKDLNKQGPMRAELPAAMKAKLAPSSDEVEKIYDQMKSAADAPVLLDKQGDGEATNVAEVPDDQDDSQSVHLFEDIELVHHLKPTRKSYGKAKKVTFQNSNGSVSGDEAVRNQSNDDDDLGDLSFHLPEVKAKKAKKSKKKQTKKQALSKKEKAEVDAWAACFNSMCEDIEEFDLVVE